MNLDKYIRISLLNLSKKYKITIIEIITAKKEKISKNFRVSYKLLEEDAIPLNKEFKNKRDLVRWLMCLR